MVTCEKCGANIPDNAAFCPECGAPKPTVQPAPKPAEQPASKPQQATPALAYKPKPPKNSGSGAQGFINFAFKPVMLTIGIFVGLLIGWIGEILDEIAVANTLLDEVGGILNFTFIAGVGGLLLCAGFLNTKYSSHIRIALIVAGAIILAANL
ncbi:MAG: zinc-ribbon domain-containing protein [Thermoplasmatales archaeon]|nr:MAG: zinc-ribbon domain-containing protein [Thermoplasmatales archaeon]